MTHGRSIKIDDFEEMRLKIIDFSAQKKLNEAILRYYTLLRMSFETNIYKIFEEPQHPYTIGLLNSALSIEGYKKELEGIGGAVPNLVNPPKGCRFHPRCKKAKPICSVEEPDIVELEEQHWIACHI